MDIGSIITGVLRLIGLLDAVKQAIHDKTVAQVATDAQRQVEATGALLDAAKVQRITENVKSMSHDELVADYYKLRQQLAHPDNPS